MVEMTEQQAIAKLQMNENKLAQIQNQINSVGRATEELRMTISTITELPTDGKKGLLPLGGAFIPVMTTDGNIYINIGAGVVVEKDKTKALTLLKTREKSLLNTMNKLQEDGVKVRNETNMIQQKLQERKQQSNVPVISG